MKEESDDELEVIARVSVAVVTPLSRFLLLQLIFPLLQFACCTPIKRATREWAGGGHLFPETQGLRQASCGVALHSVCLMKYHSGKSSQRFQHTGKNMRR